MYQTTLYKLSPYSAPGINHELINLSAEEIYLTVEHLARLDLSTNTRTRDYLYPRQVAQVLIYYFTNLSLSQVGGMFNKDHCTVINAIEKVCDRLETREMYTITLFKPLWDRYYSNFICHRYSDKLLRTIKAKTDNTRILKIMSKWTPSTTR